MTAEPRPITTLPEQDAAWIREHAWTTWMRQMDNEFRTSRYNPQPGCFLFRMSPCQLGECGACAHGRCDDCLTRRRIVEPAPWMATVATAWDIAVHGSHGKYHLVAALITRCRGWTCSCSCWRDAIADHGQLTLGAAA